MESLKFRILVVLFSFGFALGLFALYPHASQAATYYVDASRPDNSGDGQSTATAWKSIDKVNKATFQPGDNILFKRGQIWREQLTVPSSGTSGNPITFGAYGTGANPKIYRTDTYSGWWEHSLMLNGGMEYVFAGNPNDDFNDWSKQNEGNGTSIKADTTVKNSGNTSAKLTSTGNGQAFGATSYAALIKYATVSANTDYFFRVSGRVGILGDNALLLSIKDNGTNKYLDSNGNWQTNSTTVAMSWNGTTPSTWVQKAITFKPGSTSLTFVFYNFQNGNAWIDDAYFMQGTGPSSTRIWAGTINGNSNYGGAVLNGKRVIQYVNYPRLNNVFTDMANGYFYAPLNQDYFYYRSDSGPPPAMDVGARMDGILILGRSYVFVDSIDVSGQGGQVYPGQKNGGSDNTDAGGGGSIQIGDHADNITIKNLDVENGDQVGVWSGNTTTNISYQNLTVHDNQNTGVYMNGQGGGVFNCKIHDNGRLSTDGGDMGGIGVYLGGNLTISGNEVYRNGPDSGSADFEISLAAPSHPITVINNYVHDALQGGIQIGDDADGGGSNSVIAYNIINRYGTSGITELGNSSGIRIGAGNGGPARGVKILNNVITGGQQTAINTNSIYTWPTEAAIHFENDDSNVVVKNNIFFNNASRDIYVHNQASIAGAVFNNNIYSRANYNDNWSIEEYPYNSLADWQKGKNQDSLSSTSNPLFANASGNYSSAADFKLAANSPAINAGTDVGLKKDFAGTSVPQGSAPDVGTYEYQAVAPPVIQADLNSDGSVNLTDFNIIKTDFLKLTGSLTNPKSDINGDGQATIKDIGILMSGWK